MKSLKSNVRIYSENELTILQIDTWELFDFIEDYLIEECDIIYDYHKEVSNDSNHKSYNLYFPSKYSQKTIETAINKLDNNPFHKGKS